MAGAGHQHRRPGAVLGVVGQRGVPELVQGRAAGGLLEQGLGLLVGQPGPAGGVEVGRGQLHPGLALGEEHRAGLAALEQPGQEPGRAGLPDDDVDRAAFAADPGPPVGQVQVLDVEREHLGRAGGGLVQHPPQGALAEADVLAGEQLLDLGAGQGPGAVRPRLAALELAGESAAIQPCRCQYAAADRTASSETFHVDGARSAHRAVNHAANRSGSISPGPVPAPNSATTQRRIRP